MTQQPLRKARRSDPREGSRPATPGRPVPLARRCWRMAAGVAMAALLFGGGALRAAPPTWQITTVAFLTNQSCVVTQEMIQGRSQLESALKSWERYSAREAEAEPDATEETPVLPPPVIAPPTQPPAATNDFEARIRKMMTMQGRFQEGLTSRVERVEVLTNQVRMVTTMAFTTIAEFASLPLYNWTPYPLELRNARFEITNGLFRVTFTPAPRAGSALRNLSRGSQGAVLNFEWRLAFPGLLRESSLPDTNAHQAWVRIDAGNPAAITNLLQLLQKPLVFASDAAGLALPEPLETARLAARGNRTAVEPELPVAEAGPGFIAEAQSVSINTFYRFPGTGTNQAATKSGLIAPDEEGDAPDMDLTSMMLGGQGPEGLIVQGRLFAPRDRTIRTLTGLKLIRAVDDQGRPVPEAAKPKMEGVESETMQSFGGYSRGNSADFHLNLALPEPDAQSIETLEAEAIVTTLGDWQSLVISNLQADAKKEIPLDTLIPGARLVITKVETKASPKIELRLLGPRAIGLLDLKLRLGRRPVRNANTMENSPPAAGTNVTRQVTLQSYRLLRSPDSGGTVCHRAAVSARHPPRARAHHPHRAGPAVAPAGR